MPESDAKAPRVINKSGTLKMDDKVAETKQVRDISGRKMDRRNRRDRVRADVGQKEFDEITIAIDRVSRTVAGGRRMRFKALVAVGNHKNKVGIGVAKGNDVDETSCTWYWYYRWWYRAFYYGSYWCKELDFEITRFDQQSEHCLRSD